MNVAQFQTKHYSWHLLQSFFAENRLNQTEVDTTVANLEYSLKANPELIELLKIKQPDMDAIRKKMASLYNISWPDITATHLNNYLEVIIIPKAFDPPW